MAGSWPPRPPQRRHGGGNGGAPGGEAGLLPAAAMMGFALIRPRPYRKSGSETLTRALRRWCGTVGRGFGRNRMSGGVFESLLVAPQAPRGVIFSHGNSLRECLRGAAFGRRAFALAGSWRNRTGSTSRGALVRSATSGPQGRLAARSPAGARESKQPDGLRRRLRLKLKAQMRPASLPTSLAPVTVTGVSPTEGEALSPGARAGIRSRQAVGRVLGTFPPGLAFRGRSIRGPCASTGPVPALRLFPFHPRRAGITGQTDVMPSRLFHTPRVNLAIVAIPLASSRAAFAIASIRSFLSSSVPACGLSGIGPDFPSR